MDFQNNRYFHSCCGRFHVKVCSVFFKTPCKILVCYKDPHPSLDVICSWHHSGSHLFPEQLLYHGICHNFIRACEAYLCRSGLSRRQELQRESSDPIHGLLIFETVMSVCLAAFCIYGILEAEGLAERFHNSTFEFRLDLDAVLVGQVFFIVFCVWALRVVQRCYQCIEGERAFARLFYPQTTAAKVKSRLIVA
ncbi:hypothetical protein L596_023624 [Steinernema carpocapsae]|uniref:Uncharacterized protein n=1 Tax=Steinernema carpocapsae TaxID=34508 RepID=A0A4V5ZZH9_STECR|nr:hypothetical protein L596_023624 [Steinernema carpocapsae]